VAKSYNTRIVVANKIEKTEEVKKRRAARKRTLKRKRKDPAFRKAEKVKIKANKKKKKITKLDM
jgi:hypothetical protein